MDLKQIIDLYYHCYTEHDEVTIPEVNLPDREVDGNVDIDYEGFDMSIE